MLLVKAWIYSKLSGDAALVALLGGASHILDYEPEIKTNFPLVIFQKSDEYDALWNDNQPEASAIEFSIEVYSKADAAMPTTSAIGMAVANVLQPLLFASRSRDVPDPDPFIRHLHIDVRRTVMAGDLV